LFRWLRMPSVFQVFLTAALVSVAHSYAWAWPPYGFVVMPSFLIQAAAYVYWRRVSRWQSFAVVACIHALHNLIPAMYAFVYVTRKA
jgi:hypothetical protein